MDNPIPHSSTFSSKARLALHSLEQPVFASLLEDQTLRWATIGAVALHTGLTFLGLPGWICPIRENLGIPCPGCGLSRSVTALLHGDLKTSLDFHAFGPLFLLAFGILALVSILPLNQRLHLINQIRVFESKTRFSAIFLIFLVLYWLTRFLFFREPFFHLIMG